MTDYEVIERSRVIAAPADAIMSLITDFQRWSQWSPWEKLDPNQETRLSGEPSGVGAVYEWSGNRKAGQGRMEIMEADQDRVVIDLRFVKPFKSRSITEFDLRPVAGGTEVVWRMRSPKTVVSRFLGLFMSMDKMIGKDFEQGLSDLEAVATR